MDKNLELAKLLETTFRLATSVNGGILFPNSGSILLCSVHEPNQGKARYYLKYFNTNFPITAGQGSFSRSRNLRLVLQEGEKKEDLFWELWNNSRLLQVKDLKKTHTLLANHSGFGRLAWSSDDKFVLYIAEGVSKKSASFWSGEENVGNVYLHKENFGEGLRHLSEPKLFCYDLTANEVKEVVTPSNVFPAQPWFRPESNEFVFVGFEKTKYRMGLGAMINRKTKLFRKRNIEEEAEEIQIPEQFMAALFPRFSPNGKILSYLAVPKGSLSHAMCLALVVKEMDYMKTWPHITGWITSQLCFHRHMMLVI